jgi:pilus assembly protein CpaE
VPSVALVTPLDRQLEELLRASGMQTSTVDTSSLEGLSKASAAQPDAVVVDLRGGQVIPPAIATLRRNHPKTGIVIVAPALDPALLLEAMRAGVNEVVAEPLDGKALEVAISRVAVQRHADSAGQVFGFVGAKGGVGTTTVAVNVATALGTVAQGGRVLLIDLHQGGGDAAVFLGADPRFSVQHALDNTHRLDQTFLRSLVVTVAPNLDLLAAPDSPTSGQLDVSKLRAVIASASAAYRFTVLDLPASDGAVLDSLEALSQIILVANQELATVKGASRMASALQRRYGRNKVAVVLSRSDRQADIGHADIERAVGTEISYTFPSDYRQALQALNKGRPLALDNHNELSASFRRFALRLAGIRSERSQSPRTGLLGRLTTGRG